MSGGVVEVCAVDVGVVVVVVVVVAVVVVASVTVGTVVVVVASGTGSVVDEVTERNMLQLTCISVTF